MKKYILLLISFVGLNLYAANFTLIPNCNDSRLNTFKSGTLSNGTAYTCDECFDAGDLYYRSGRPIENLTQLYDTFDVVGNTTRIMWQDETWVDWDPLNITKFTISTSLTPLSFVFDAISVADPQRQPFWKTAQNAPNSGRRFGIFYPNDPLLTYISTPDGISLDGVSGTATPLDAQKPMWRIAFNAASHTTNTSTGVSGPKEDHVQCAFVFPKWCGDGIKDDGTNGTENKGEQCDDGNMTNGDGCSSVCMTETPVLSCNNLTLAPTTLTNNGGTITATCAATNATQYRFVLKRDGTQIQTKPYQSGTQTTFVLPANTDTSAKEYTVECFVKNANPGEQTGPNCNKGITVPGTVVIPPAVCDSLTLHDADATIYRGESVNYTCNTDPVNPPIGTTYSILRGTGPTGGTQIFQTKTGTISFDTAGTYYISCRVNGDPQVDACRKQITVNVPTTPYIAIDKRDNNTSGDLDGSIGNDTQTVNSGAAAIFKIRVTNNGTEDLKNITLTDTNAPACAGAVTLGATPTKPATWTNFVTGGSGNHSNNLLEPGEYFEYTCSKANTTIEYVNIARVDAVGNTSNQPVSANDPTSIVLAPICNSLSLSHTTVQTNTPVNYLCSATNATSYIIKQGSNIIGTLPEGTISFPTSGSYSIGCFINGQTDTPIACAKNITVTAPPIVTNPSIFIDKDDSTPGTPDSDGNDIQRVQNNGTATFTVFVRNNGDEALKTVVIEDAFAPDCARTAAQTAILYAGGSSTNFDIGETFTYQCTRNSVTSSTFPANRNTATVRGVGVTSGTNVTDSDVSEVFLKQVNPSIQVEKDDTDNLDDEQEIDEDDTAKFSVKVTNNGTEALDNVTLTDDLSPDCDRDESETRSLIREIGNEDALFDPGETFAYTCRETSVTIDTFPDEINTICTEASGVDTNGRVDDCDDTNIIVNEEEEELLMCMGIDSSKGTFGGAPFRTTVTCEVIDYDSCEIEVMKDGKVINTYDACSQSITFSETGNYSVACIVDEERTPDCEMEITVEAMTDIPTGAKILILALLSLIGTALGTHLYKKRAR